MFLPPPLYVPRHQRKQAPPPSTQQESSYRINNSEGYHPPVAPPGSYQDDDTGPSPRTLVTAVIGMKRAVTQFAKVLDTDMKNYPKEMEMLKQAIRDEVGAEVERPNDWKFLVRAFLCRRLFLDFDAPNGYYGLEDFAEDKMTTINSFVDFTKFKDLSATISKLMKPPSPDQPYLEKSKFLERFCFKKFMFIFNEDTQPLHRDELAAVQSGRHPNTSFYQSFLNVAVSVWLLHRLVHSFDEKVDMLTYEPGCPFQRQSMESVVPGVVDDDEDEENDENIRVIFTVIPGFQVSRSVIKSCVYIPDEKTSQLATPHRPSIDKTPIKPDPSTNKSPSKTPISSDKTLYKRASSTDKSPATVKSSSNRSLGTLFAVDGTHSSRSHSHPGSFQSPGGVTSISNHESQFRRQMMQGPTRSGNVAAATVADAGDNWQTHQARSSPGNSASLTPKSRPGVRESSSGRHAHAQPASTTTVFTYPASAPAPAASRPYNPNGAPLAARPTKLSEGRRIANANAAKKDR